ncbi:MAG: hypothetical protein JWP89_124 [Schlesneria sp.]|nr:hypothetical protein [Schlesneria sp.]
MPSPAAVRRQQFRDNLFEGAESRTWDRKTNNGFTTIPRLLPYVTCLIRMLAEKNDPSSVYIDLWARAFDEGVASITDESVAAFSSGYTGSRAVRTWRERMKVLAELGFIEPKAAGNRQFAHVLVVDPLKHICKLRRTDPEKVPEAFWTAFLARAQEIGAKLQLTEEPAVDLDEFFA